ncbi:MAG: hypothetical protein ACRD6X_06475 [Pyrinomonadaceae bacterium]
MRIAMVLVFPLLLAFSFMSAQSQTKSPFGLPSATPTPRPTPPPPPAPKIQPCPSISVQAQAARQVRDGQPVFFAAKITGGDPQIRPTLIWNLTAGSMKNGQGTTRLEVDTTTAGSAFDRKIVASLWVGGYAPECSPEASAEVNVIPPATKFGEFGELPATAVTENLKALATFLSQSNDNVYLIAYAGRKSERSFAYTWIRKIRDELAANDVSARRVIGLDGGFREEPLFDFWIVPIGATPPRPAPTVNRNEIVYPSPPSRRKP